MPSTKQERDFKDYLAQKIEATLSSDSLQEAMDWIGSELDPEDVFSTKQLESWAESNGYTKE